MDVQAFVHLVKEAKSIKFLSVDKLSIDAEAMENILQTIGQNLEEFHVSIDGQRQSAAQSIEIVLGFAGTHCRNLKVLRLLKMNWESLPFHGENTIFTG